MPSIEGALLFLLNYIGRLVCHQLPERTLWVGGHYLPVCARDTGVYLGFFLGYLLLSRRKKEARGPPNLILTSLMVLPMIVDAGTQFVGLRTSTNEFRLATGLLFGTALAPLLVYSLAIVSTSRKVPVLRGFLPKAVSFDDKDNWLDFKWLGVGALFAMVLYITIMMIVGSTNGVFYWLLSPLIIVSVVLHIFLLPIFVIGLAVFPLGARWVHAFVRKRLVVVNRKSKRIAVCEDREREHNGIYLR